MLNAHLDCTAPISLKKPTAYNLLDRMEKDGWVQHRDEPTGERPRRVYSVTDEGGRAFLDLLKQQLGAFVPPELPGLVSLSFLDAVPSSEASHLLEQRRAELTQYRAALDHHGEEGSSTGEHHTGSAWFAMEYTRRLLDLETRLLDEVIESLESK
jgi:DNA-binding PadR family transcriptional regulator